MRMGEKLLPELEGDVPADGVAGVAVYPTFSLLEVDGVRRRVPVDDGMAPPVEIDSVLTHAGGCQDKWPERTAEGASDLGLPNALFVGATRAPHRHHRRWYAAAVTLPDESGSAGRGIRCHFVRFASFWLFRSVLGVAGQGILQLRPARANAPQEALVCRASVPFVASS
jgi:hypothetical protein